MRVRFCSRGKLVWLPPCNISQCQPGWKVVLPAEPNTRGTAVSSADGLECQWDCLFLKGRLNFFAAETQLRLGFILLRDLPGRLTRSRTARCKRATPGLTIGSNVLVAMRAFSNSGSSPLMCIRRLGIFVLLLLAPSLAAAQRPEPAAPQLPVQLSLNPI